MTSLDYRLLVPLRNVCLQPARLIMEVGRWIMSMLDVVLSFLLAIQCIILTNNRKLIQIQQAIGFNTHVLNYRRVNGRRDADVLVSCCFL